AEIDRGGHAIIAPDPETRLYPGDRLLLLGSPDAIAKATAELEQPSDDPDHGFADARLEVVAVPAEIPPETTLANLRTLHVSGALVVGVERNGQHLTRIDGHERLLPGDRLLVLGAPGNLREFRRQLSRYAISAAVESRPME
ncbi:MAG TPA: TrkA C-terminal domain-containing protein, partial [Candidatus Synoicihabitans sp.]|nr:TrkA C-terminal domain-containing protein [Candidatus Synoicihabitans sp.]